MAIFLGRLASVVRCTTGLSTRLPSHLGYPDQQDFLLNSHGGTESNPDLGFFALDL